VNIEKQVEKSIGNKREPKLGDKVIHRLSGSRGVISETGMVGDQHIVSVTLPSGKILAKLNWREVSLDSSTPTVQIVNTDESGTVSGRWEMTIPEGPISGESLLGELV
jgi:hypothetical protein